ncbi:MAG: nitrate reductase molybdenum cofactor assembly chaperone, partial [Candidatus Cloacimonetes bacterium]|nr:nitrate reductase molybdenum cofactor assembly chaperone [Candidatus Cloacimonadota bacterium]
MAGLPNLLQRVTRRQPLPEQSLAAVRLSRAERSRTHMIASLLLDYPDATWFERLEELHAHAQGLPEALATEFTAFIAAAQEAGPVDWQRRYVTTFDLKRKCSLYLSYFATGDTRRRGTALVTFIEAYRAAGWELDAAELPDYLPVVLEFSARSEDPIAEALLASHVEGIEVLRAALEGMQSPWASVVRAVTLSLPEVDERTRERVLAL